MVQALESSKFNFAGMQILSDKSLAKEYRTTFPTFQDRLTIIQANLDYLQVKKIKFEVEYQKVGMSKISLELTVTMDACELRIAIERTKHLEKENDNLDTRLCSQANDLRESTKTIKHLQLNIQELSCHVLITQEQLEDL
jgi:hypothetical protein